jgi:tRNA-specific 2-thiouridylase
VGGNDVPLYVIALDPVRQQVTVGPKASLQRDVFWIRDFNWLLEDLPVTTFEAIVQVRSRHEGTKVRVSIEDRSLIKVEFIDEWIPVAAGQAGVIYGLDNSRVFGGGTISSKLCY